MNGWRLFRSSKRAKLSLGLVGEWQKISQPW
jgi:hypothetical protein